MLKILKISNCIGKAQFCSLRKLLQILFRYLFPALCGLCKMETGPEEIRVLSFWQYEMFFALRTPE